MTGKQGSGFWPLSLVFVLWLISSFVGQNKNCFNACIAEEYFACLHIACESET